VVHPLAHLGEGMPHVQAVEGAGVVAHRCTASRCGRGSAARSAALRSQASKPRALRSSLTVAPRFAAGVARRLAPLHSAHKPRNPAPYARRSLLHRVSLRAWLGGSLRCTPLTSLETPRPTLVAHCCTAFRCGR